MIKKDIVRRKWKIILVIGGLVLMVGIGFLVKYGIENARRNEILARFPDRDVPRINIELNGVGLEEIKGGTKDIKYEGNELTIYDSEGVSEYEDVEVKGRGNGTWGQEKKPFQIKFQKKVDLFEMGKARKWLLLANAMDATNLRTATAFYLEEMLGMRYRFEGKFVELYVNNEYEGLYYLTHAVEIGKDVIDLKEPTGVLVELDNIYGGVEYHYLTQNGDKLVPRDILDKDKLNEAMEDFIKDYNEFEEAVGRKDYEKIKELVDVESFAEYYLLSEFSVNPDAYWTSFYMYKDGLNDKIHAGIGWDFDLAFANRNWGNWMGEAFYSPTGKMARKGELITKEEYDELGVGGYEMSLLLSRIMFDLMEVSEFREEVLRIFGERMSGRKDELVMAVLKKAEEIERLTEENYKKWNNGDYKKDLEEMVEWIEVRYDYFEEEYGGQQKAKGVI